MFDSAVCSVHIDCPSKNGYWSDGEEVSGLIEVEVRREIQIASIEAQLRCGEKARVCTKGNERVVFLYLILIISKFCGLALRISLRFYQKVANSPRVNTSSHLVPSFLKIAMMYLLASRLNPDFNGVFWGAYAVIDCDARLRYNHRGFRENKMFPERHHRELRSSTYISYTYCPFQTHPSIVYDQ